MKKLTFEQWKKELEEHLNSVYAVGTDDCSDTEEMRYAHSNDETPEQFATWKMDKYDVHPVDSL